jgi:hypothetical protein
MEVQLQTVETVDIAHPLLQSRGLGEVREQLQSHQLLQGHQMESIILPRLHPLLRDSLEPMAGVSPIQSITTRFLFPSMLLQSCQGVHY